MIATNIDGSTGGANSLFDLLSLVANPEASAKRLADLQAATAEHKQYVDAVAPATEILALREQAKAVQAEAVAVLDAARREADSLRAVASQEAAAIKAAATSAAQKVAAAAEVQAAAAGATQAEVTAKLHEAQMQERRMVEATSALAERLKEVETLRSQALASKQEYESLRAALQAKYQAFLGGL